MDVAGSSPDLLTSYIVSVLPLLIYGLMLGVGVYIVLLLRRLVHGTERIANALAAKADQAVDEYPTAN